MIKSLIVAMGKNREIGLDNKLLWHIPDDMKNFVRITKGKPILVGRKTFESFKKPLPGRLNVVVTRDVNFKYDHPLVKIFYDINMALDYLEGERTPEVVICGGAGIYGEFIDQVDKMYISFVDWEGKADTFFPECDFSSFKIITKLEHPRIGQISPAWTFVEYDRL